MNKSPFKSIVGCLVFALPMSAYALDQWATKVLDFSSQYSDTSWSAAQALKAPNVTSYGDNANAWTASGSDVGSQYLTLGYAKQVYATGVTIRETYGWGFVYQVDVIDTSNVPHTVWTGTDTSLPTQINNFKVTWPKTKYLVKAVKIYIDTDLRVGYEEIDAVQLRGVESLGGTIAPRLTHTAELICTNETTSQTLTRTIKGPGKVDPVTKWDCEKAGLIFKPGDKVSIKITGAIGK